MKGFRHTVTFILAVLTSQAIGQPTEPSGGIFYPIQANYGSAVSNGTWAVWYGCEGNTFTSYRNEIIKPFILIEGFDALNAVGLFENTDDASWKENITLYDQPLNQAGLVDNLRAAGYDIIILNITDGGEDIRASGRLVAELINEVNDRLVANGSKHELVIMGTSAGGLRSRYALSYMEANNLDHRCKLWITMDTPHFGANVPLGLQHWLKFMVKVQTVLSLSLFTGGPLGDNLDKMLNSDAGKQMLFYHHGSTNNNNDEAKPDPKHREFYDDMEALNNNNGFPELPRTIAMANGSRSNIDLGFSPGDNLFDFRTVISLTSLTLGIINLIPLPIPPPWVITLETRVNAVKDHANKHIFLGRLTLNGLGLLQQDISVDNTEPYDNASGGYVEVKHKNGTTTNGLHATFIEAIPLPFLSKDKNPDCFIPVYSALALTTTNGIKEDVTTYAFPGDVNLAYHTSSNTAVTPFDALYARKSNSGHVEILASEMLWATNETTPDHLYLQNQTKSGEAAYQAQFITSGNDVEPVLNKQLMGDYIIEANADVDFQAKNVITLKPGFHAQAGSSFHAFIDGFGCGGTQCKTAGDAGNHSATDTMSIPEIIFYEVMQMELEEVIKTIEFNFSVRPNPNSGKFTLHLHSENPASIVISNMAGNTVYEMQSVNLGSHELNISDLPKGIYFVKVVSGDEMFVKKIVHQ